jgi:hypothetical protein
MVDAIIAQAGSSTILSSRGGAQLWMPGLACDQGPGICRADKLWSGGVVPSLSQPGA